MTGVLLIIMRLILPPSLHPLRQEIHINPPLRQRPPQRQTLPHDLSPTTLIPIHLHPDDLLPPPLGLPLSILQEHIVIHQLPIAIVFERDIGDLVPFAGAPRGGFMGPGAGEGAGAG